MLRWKMGLALGAVVMVFGSVGAAAQSSRFEEHVLKELNRLRIDPPAFSDEIADTRSRFDGRILRGREGD